VIKSIVEAAARAPSGDNVQPWNFTWNGETLTVRFRPDLARHVLDAGFSASTIALGCLLESFRIAASVHGLSARFAFSGVPEQEGPCAEIRFVDDGRPPDALASALPNRTTDRRLYRRGSIPTKDLVEIWGEFDRKDVARFDCAGSISRDLLNFIVSAESLAGRHSSILPDTLPWIRFSRKEVARTQDGMPWRGTGVGLLEYPVLYLMRLLPQTFQLFRRTGMGAMQAARVKRLLQSSAGLLCLSTSETGPQALVSIGRLSMRLWLRLSQLGYGVQPLAISSLLMYNARHGMLDPETGQLFGGRYPEGERLFRREFGIPEGAEPVWLLRIGISDPLPPSWQTPRRDVTSVLRVSTENPVTGCSRQP
jgi:hypothetical protein